MAWLYKLPFSQRCFIEGQRVGERLSLGLALIDRALYSNKGEKARAWIGRGRRKSENQQRQERREEATSWLR